MNSDVVEASAITNGEGLIEYEKIIRIVENQIPFRGKTISQWTREISLPPLSEHMSLHELEAFNHKFINSSYVIMDCLSVARSAMAYTKNHMDMAIIRQKSQLEDSIAAWNSNPANVTKRKLPARDILNDRAMADCSDAVSAYRVSEIFYEFWKTFYEKLKVIGDRLTGMNILKNTESKLG